MISRVMTTSAAESAMRELWDTTSSMVERRILADLSALTPYQQGLSSRMGLESPERCIETFRAVFESWQRRLLREVEKGAMSQASRAHVGLVWERT